MTTRKTRSVKNVSYNLISFCILAVMTFISRKFFIKYLTLDIAGLQSIFSNVLSFLNLAELGIGSAVIFSLYKPIADNNMVEIKGILDLFKKFYRNSGLVILTCGIIVSFFLEHLVKNQIDINKVRLYFIIYLLNTVFTYFFTHKYCLLIVNEENHVISKVDIIVKLVKNILQIIILILLKSYMSYLLLEISFNLMGYAIINLIIRKKYGWLNNTKGVISNSIKFNIVKNIKALFYHQLGGFVVFGTDNLVIAYFMDLKTVGLYGNYYLLINFFIVITGTVFTSIIASIGNLLIEKDVDSSYEVFKKIFFVNFLLSSFLTIALYNNIDKFIYLWLGKDFLINKLTIIVLLINFYLTTMKNCVDAFKRAAGIYHNDRLAPLAEAIINLVCSIILVQLIGLPGVFIGTLISNLTIGFWIKPYMVYKYIFKRTSSNYYKEYVKYALSGVLILFITNFIINLIVYKINIFSFLISCSLCITISIVMYFILFRKAEEYKYFKRILLDYRKNHLLRH
jgi:O-antigen/teichoic acid export membrane protein